MSSYPNGTRIRLEDGDSLTILSFVFILKITYTEVEIPPSAYTSIRLNQVKFLMEEVDPSEKPIRFSQSQSTYFYTTTIGSSVCLRPIGTAGLLSSIC